MIKQWIQILAELFSWQCWNVTTFTQMQHLNLRYLTLPLHKMQRLIDRHKINWSLFWLSQFLIVPPSHMWWFTNFPLNHFYWLRGLDKTSVVKVSLWALGGSCDGHFHGWINERAYRAQDQGPSGSGGGAPVPDGSSVVCGCSVSIWASRSKQTSYKSAPLHQ